MIQSQHIKKKLNNIFLEGEGGNVIDQTINGAHECVSLIK